MYSCSTCKQVADGSLNSELTTKEKFADRSAEIFALIQTVDPKKDWQGFRIYDLMCALEYCEYYFEPRVKRGSKKTKFSGNKSKDLFKLLQTLPVSKGESGVGTSFISCQKYKLSDSMDFQCEIAIQMNSNI